MAPGVSSVQASIEHNVTLELRRVTHVSITHSQVVTVPGITFQLICNYREPTATPPVQLGLVVSDLLSRNKGHSLELQTVPFRLDPLP